VAGLVWLAVVSAGLGLMARYENSPGTVRSAPESLPSTIAFESESGLLSLVMILHPRCPCSRASIGELEKIMARCAGRVRAQVLCFKPEGAADNWAQTDLWHSAAAIPGVRVRTDEAGREAARLGAETSGQTLLYDTDGKLLFQGGITAGRGHAGDNPGSEAVLAAVNGATAREASRVFGCPIHDRCDSQLIRME
jgi:hypothetical protein